MIEYVESMLYVNEFSELRGTAQVHLHEHCVEVPTVCKHTHDKKILFICI